MEARNRFLRGVGADDRGHACSVHAGACPRCRLRHRLGEFVQVLAAGPGSLDHGGKGRSVRPPLAASESGLAVSLHDQSARDGSVFPECLGEQRQLVARRYQLLQGALNFAGGKSRFRLRKEGGQARPADALAFAKVSYVPNSRRQPKVIAAPRQRRLVAELRLCINPPAGMTASADKETLARFIPPVQCGGVKSTRYRKNARPLAFWLHGQCSLILYADCHRNSLGRAPMRLRISRRRAVASV
jgi:hypothetical protein